MAIDLEQELAVAVSAVRSAAKVCRNVQRTIGDVATLSKDDKSPVTVADFASQAIVCAVLSDRSAIGAIVGEEAAEALREPEAERERKLVVEHVRSVRGDETDAEHTLAWIDKGGFDPAGATGPYWTVDPIDGTKGFLRGDHYAIALGLIDGGEVVLGVLGCPRLAGPGGAPGLLLCAARGRGTEARALFSSTPPARRAKVNDLRSASEARFCESVEASHSDQGRSARIALCTAGALTRKLAPPDFDLRRQNRPSRSTGNWSQWKSSLLRVW